MRDLRAPFGVSHKDCYNRWRLGTHLNSNSYWRKRENKKRKVENMFLSILLYLRNNNSNCIYVHFLSSFLTQKAEHANSIRTCRDKTKVPSHTRTEPHPHPARRRRKKIQTLFFLPSPPWLSLSGWLMLLLPLHCIKIIYDTPSPLMQLSLSSRIQNPWQNRITISYMHLVVNAGYSLSEGI